MKLQRRYVIGLSMLIVAVVGCGPKLASEQVLEVSSNDIRTVVIEPASAEQSVAISAKSDGPLIKVFVYLASDEEEVNQAITLGKESAKIIASELDATEIELTAKIPADQEASVRIQGGSSEKANVTLWITN